MNKNAYSAGECSGIRFIARSSARIGTPMKKLCFSIIISVVIVFMAGCGTESDDDNIVIVYNWGEYIDPDMLELFEEETGISVV